MKKTLLISVIVLVIALAVGCACAVQPSPSPSPGTAASPGLGTSPGIGTSPDTGISPGLGTSPGMSPGTSPGNGNGTDTGEAGIPGFAAGTEIEIETVPDIKAAVDEKYPDANILSVVYAMYQDEQVYKVSLTQEDGQVLDVNVRPDGTFIDETGQTP